MAKQNTVNKGERKYNEQSRKQNTRNKDKIN